MNKYFSFIILVFGLTLISCNKENHNVEMITYQQELLSIETLNQIGLKVHELQKKEFKKNSDYEEEMKEILLPLVECGNKLIDDIRKEYELDNSLLTLEEINSINLMTDEQIASFAFVLSASQISNISNTKVDYVACIGAALGLDVIHGLLTNTAQLATVQGATRLLKVLAKRYIGWIGVGVAVYSFLDCIDVI
jgi:hypothetical protein